MTEYGPGDRWPEHPKAWWRDVIELARARGWHLRLSSGHAWGTLVCPQSCKVIVFSTGRGGESVAKSARLKIERCGHGTTTSTAVAMRHLTDAERLADAAADLIARLAGIADIEEMLTLADAALGAAQERRLLDLIDALPHAGDPPAEAVLAEAEDHVRSAASDIGGLTGQAGRPLRARVRSIRRRIGELRRQLDA